MFGEILQIQIGQPIFGMVHLRHGACCFAIGRGAAGSPPQRSKPWDPSRPRTPHEKTHPPRDGLHGQAVESDVEDIGRIEATHFRCHPGRSEAKRRDPGWLGPGYFRYREKSGMTE